MEVLVSKVVGSKSLASMPVPDPWRTAAPKDPALSFEVPAHQRRAGNLFGGRAAAPQGSGIGAMFLVPIVANRAEVQVGSIPGVTGPRSSHLQSLHRFELKFLFLLRSGSGHEMAF